MSDERLKFLGRRSEMEMRRTELTLRVETLVTSLRDELDPFKAPSDLRTDTIALLAMELAEKRDRLVETLAELKKIREILGR